MAKVTGPLLSISASGSVAKALVFFPWKGRSLVRKWLIPSNPSTAGQLLARGYLAAGSQAIQWMNGELHIKAGQTETDKVRHIAAAPAGIPWQSNVMDSMIGSDAAYWAIDAAAWTALAALDKDAWDNAAEAKTPPFADYSKFSVTYRSGEQFFHIQGANSRILGDAYPTGVPPVYA